MKFYCLLFLIIMLATQSKAQNWQCIQPGTKTYFTNQAGYLRGMRIDSVKANGASTIAFPFHTLRGVYREQGWPPLPLDSNGRSWLGTTIITNQSSGNTWFINGAADTLIINMLAARGTSWIFYNDTSEVFYTATITAADTMTIEGTLDSVKRIALQAGNSAGPVGGDPINQYELILSKAHGLVRAFDFYNFPYTAWRRTGGFGADYFFFQVSRDDLSAVANQFNRVPFHNPASEALYNYQPGDTYQFTTSKTTNFNLSNGTRKMLITAKRDFPDCVEYDITETEVWHNSFANPPVYSNNTGNTTQTFNKGVKMLIDTVLMPEEYGSAEFYYYHPDDSAQCLRSARYTRQSNYIYDNRVNTFESCGLSETFKIGRGRVMYWGCTDPAGYGESEELTYIAKTTGPICGSYNPLSAAIHAAQEKGIDLYPNPASTEVNLRLRSFSSATPVAVSVFDFTGKIMLHTSIAHRLITINTANWPAGLYAIQCRIGDATSISKLTITH